MNSPLSTASKPLFWPWTLACGAGEFVGIGVAAAITVLGVQWLGEPHDALSAIATLLLAMGAGVIEGGLTGYLQWRVLRQKFHRIRAGAWMGVTALGAAIAWLLGSLPATLIQMDASAEATAPPDPSPLFMVALGAGMGLVLGAFWGFWQWLLLRRHAIRAKQWIRANALGWLLGMPFIFLAASLPDVQTPLPEIIALAVAGGLLAGLTVGLVTAWYFVRLTPVSYNEP